MFTVAHGSKSTQQIQKDISLQRKVSAHHIWPLWVIMWSAFLLRSRSLEGEVKPPIPNACSYMIYVISPECIASSCELSHIQLFWWIFWNNTFFNKEIYCYCVLFRVSILVFFTKYPQSVISLGFIFSPPNSLFFNAFRQSLGASRSFLTSTFLFQKKDLCFAAKGYPSPQVSAAQQSPQRLSYISTTYWNGQGVIRPIRLCGCPDTEAAASLKRLLLWRRKLQTQTEAVSGSAVGETTGKVRGGQALVCNRKCKWKPSVTVVCRGGPN